MEGIVTLDVLHTGVIWGWYVTMNFWAKSIATGVFLLGPFLWRRFPQNAAFYRTTVPVLGFIFLNITLLFTVLDLHQPFRFWHMFLYPHFTSVINLGAWVLTVYNGLLALLIWFAYKKLDGLYDRLVIPTWIVAFLATIYTAGLLGQQNARELWQTATEVPQMLLAATIAGSACLVLFPRPGPDERTALAWVLGLSAAVALTIFVSEVVFAPQKSEEAELIVRTLVTGDLRNLFLSGLFLGFVAPMALAFFGIQRRSASLLPAAAVSSLVGLWLVKHAWLIAPQLLPLS
ncbi:MAG: polysulfide reductase NrfD [Deltaproteobacteria bacterium]|nr:polysulfide reductase NrfD [Deltaproteobacteria bacterium]